MPHRRVVRSSALGRKGTCERDNFAIRSALQLLVNHSRRNQSRRTGIRFVPVGQAAAPKRRRPAAKRAPAKRRKVVRRRRMAGGACGSCGSCRAD